MANRLQNEKSPYLLQHKDNPVDWYPWGEEAFETAALEDKPVFLSIGYSTCHWCHVMAQESFEDSEIAEILGDFICIKVDREERPDIDSIYMDVCQALTGAGGWPLTVLMTPEQKPFFVGTYFPKRSRRGRQGLAELIKRASSLWNSDRERLLEIGDRVTDMLLEVREHGSGEPDRGLLSRAYEHFRAEFRADFGGFGHAPKFPTPHNLLFLLRYYACEKEPNALFMVERTLEAMASGGIFDHIGGGFSRYSTDERWLIPHFEKMLYDNALLIPAYLEAYQLTGRELYAQVAGRCADYILRELSGPEGGFCCGQDADSDGVEGKFYAFTPEEIIGVLGQEKGEAFCRRYGITESGNFEGKSIPNRIGQRLEGLHADAPELKALYEYREQRTTLYRDDKILLSWNAWAIIALARAGFILCEEGYLTASSSAVSFIEAHMTDGQNRLFHRFREGEAAHKGQLDDYAVYALALLELYRVTFKADYLERAVLRAEQMVELFADGEHGGYFLSPHDAQPLISRPKELYDGALPSGNSVAAAVLVKIASLTGEVKWQERADRQLRFISGGAAKYPAGHSFSLLALADSLYPHRELICVGSSAPSELLRYLRQRPAHDISLLLKTAENQAQLASAAPFTSAYPLPNQGTVYYLCENGACRAPAAAFEELKQYGVGND